MKEVVEKQNWGQKEEDMYKTVDFYARKGLRTLVFGYKRVDKDEYKADLENIEVSQMEQNYSLIGVTGVEDTLQDNVVECIIDFKKAGMKVWILTGDKRETAESIGKTCGVLNSNMKICYI